ncbi:MAG: flagellar FliJ family protein [Alphaproteobacteria bacterium]|nr:flagellar FliJ family protein [Alphaproteobacteria bacterium]MDG1888448.1 flagellar FliJ family protein [Alphaproteobacteria bacterium]
MIQFEKLLQLREFELDERRRESGKILSEVNFLQDEITRLHEELKSEQKIAAESLEARFLYNEFASSVIRKREWLMAAIKSKEEEYERAREKVTEAYREMRKAEIIRDDLMEKTKKHEQALEQVELDEIAQNIHRRTSK